MWLRGVQRAPLSRWGCCNGSCKYFAQHIDIPRSPCIPSEFGSNETGTRHYNNWLVYVSWQLSHSPLYLANSVFADLLQTSWTTPVVSSSQGSLGFVSHPPDSYTPLPPSASQKPLYSSCRLSCAPRNSRGLPRSPPLTPSCSTAGKGEIWVTSLCGYQNWPSRRPPPPLQISEWLRVTQQLTFWDVTSYILLKCKPNCFFLHKILIEEKT